MERKLKDATLLSLILIMASAGSAAMVLVRWGLTRRITHVYLIWNLLLAWLPYLISLGALRLSRMEAPGRRRLLVGLVSIAWLVFYPNSPYIFTDFIHVARRSHLLAGWTEWLTPNSLLWYDVILNTTFAFIGHFIGLISMSIVHSALRRCWGRRTSWSFIIPAILLSGFGVYLGRFVRLNSWDLFLHPLKTMGRIAGEGTKPLALLFSLTFSFFIATTYLVLRFFKKVGLPEAGTDPGSTTET